MQIEMLLLEKSKITFLGGGKIIAIFFKIHFQRIHCEHKRSPSVLGDRSVKRNLTSQTSRPVTLVARRDK